MSELLGRLTLGAICGFIALWLVAPTLVIIPMSFADRQSLAFPPTGFSLQWYKNIFTDAAWSGSLWTSIKIGSVVAVLATAIGAMAALGIHRMQSRAGAVIRLMLLTPIIIPGVVLAVGIYAVCLQTHMVGTYSGFILAHTLLAIPFVIIAVGASLAMFDNRLETAAASLGASKLSTFFSVTVPLIMPGLVSGAIFAFVTSFDEVVVSLFIASPQIKTLPVQIYSSMTRDSDPTVAALGTLMFAATLLAVSASFFFSSKGRKS
ncbi:ABC transporter permease [Pseudomonas taiwanensis]|uniref:ABC transporter permease n=1 Tax=Pseudomonas taiwanensis TaxID=470150 RepID=UPI0004129010|nr:ABC transporter permease [Pseudomonas taiwanensis]